jgi:argininosuccinate lyase
MVQDLVKGLPGGYNRDLQEAKKPFLEGTATTRATLRIMTALTKGLKVNRKALEAGFEPGVFATDQAIELVGQGVPFRDAYQQVKKNLDALSEADPYEAIAAKTHLGATSGIDYGALENRAKEAQLFVKDEEKAYHKALSKLLGVTYPLRG